MSRREGEGDVRVRGGMTGAVVADRRCYGDLADRGHQAEGVNYIGCPDDVRVRGDDGGACHGEVLQSICGEISTLECLSIL